MTLWLSKDALVFQEAYLYNKIRHTDTIIKGMELGKQGMGQKYNELKHR